MSLGLRLNLETILCNNHVTMTLMSLMFTFLSRSRFPHSSGVPGVGGSNGIAGILEPTTLQGTKAEPELPIRGAVSLFIMAQNLNLSMLSAKSDLAASFRATIQEDIARELGPGFTPEHVDVRLLAESAAIPVTITAPSGVSCHDLHRWLCNKPLRWAGNKSSKLSTLEGFSAVCLSPSWCLCTIGMPSIVDEASTTVSGGSPLALQVSLAQDLQAVPDEQDLVLPRCLQRTGHTPRDDPGKPPRASPKRRSMAKVGREWRERSKSFLIIQNPFFAAKIATNWLQMGWLIEERQRNQTHEVRLFAK